MLDVNQFLIANIAGESHGIARVQRSALLKPAELDLVTHGLQCRLLCCDCCNRFLARAEQCFVCTLLRRQFSGERSAPIWRGFACSICRV